MSDSIDKLLDLLLDLEPPTNIANSQKQSSPQKKSILSTKPKKRLASAEKAKIVSPKTAQKSSIDKIVKAARKTENQSEPPNNLIAPAELKKSLSEVKGAEVASDDPIQAISSIISNITDRNTKNSNNNFSPTSPEILLEDWIAQKEQQLNDLAESLNNLIPLMVELLSVKVNDSQEVILQTMIPIIDRVIEERSTQDLDKMALVIAKILPNAITHEIKIQPHSLGKAIAPELALSIEEQIRLDQDAISLALGSEMGKSIKAQIELEKDAMVDALYPVIGNTISKYLTEELARINSKVEKALSPEGISRKIRAKMQGVSEAELILRESLICTVRAIFLIQKDSGLVICDIQPDQQYPLESELVAGMLTAIRSFANDCIVSGSELSEIDYGNFQILLEAAGYCYIAVVINGLPKPEFRERIRKTLGKIVMQYGKLIEAYDGDTSTIPSSIILLLKDLTTVDPNGASEEESKKSLPILVWLAIILLAGILLPWGILKHRAIKAERITQEVAEQLDSNPQLSVYSLQPQVNQENITITGKVSSNYLRNLAETIIAEIATEANLNIDNQIIAVDVPPDPTFIAQEVTRVNNLLNQFKGVAITSSYQDDIVTVTGFLLETVSSETITSAFSAIPGVKQVVFTVKQELPKLDTRIYFDVGESDVTGAANLSKIESIKQFLAQYPNLNLKVIGHSDTRGSKIVNQQLALERANKVAQIAISQGVVSQRLEIVTSETLPPDVTPNQPLRLSRCVRFEPFIP